MLNFLIYTLGIMLASGFVTWIFTYRHAYRKGFFAGEARTKRGESAVILTESNYGILAKEVIE